MADRKLVRGEAKLGDRVSYEDMANPRRVGTVTEVDSRLPYYRILWDAEDQVPVDPNVPDGTKADEAFSDMRQVGWTFEPTADDREAHRVCIAAEAAARMIGKGMAWTDVFDEVYPPAYALATAAAETAFGVGLTGLAEDGRLDDVQRTFQSIAEDVA